MIMMSNFDCLAGQAQFHKFLLLMFFRFEMLAFLAISTHFALFICGAVYGYPVIAGPWF